MPSLLPTRAELKLIEKLVNKAVNGSKNLTQLLNNLFSDFSADAELTPYIHSMKVRVKDAEHLRDKLLRKLSESKVKGELFHINEENLFGEINDLAGLRLLHLHTRQFEHISRCLNRIFDEHFYKVVEKPTARVWDIESRDYFESIGIECVDSDSMYTSVHYVIAPNRQTLYTCEIQVRTLAEELWGEVDHSMNYPNKTESLACREQIKVLARVTSSCSRLVDSIFRSHEDHLANAGERRSKKG